MAGLLVQIVGALLILSALVDVFLTVLYARIGAGFLAHRLACWIWAAMKVLARPFSKWHDSILSFCGPIIIVSVVALWVSLLTCGGALIIYPSLGTSFQATSGPTPTDFATAANVAGDAMSTAGTADIAPKTPFFRIFYMMISFVGILVITLTVTYLLEVYNALQQRNTFAIKLHMATGETGDAAELLAGVGPQGRFSVGYAHLVEIAAEMAEFKESHHFYSVLVYFRFRDPHYAVSRLALVCLDTVTLIKSALTDHREGWLKESAAVEQLWRGTMHLMVMVTESFVPGGLPEPNDERVKELEGKWRARYFAALARLKQAGIETIEDEAAGADTYVNLRRKWDRYLTSFADHMAHDMETIDRIVAHPEDSYDRPVFETKLRSAG